MKERYKILRKLEHANANLNFGLTVFGDDLAKREGYRSFDGIEAVQYYLVQKHNWLPSVVKSMSHEDLRFCMEEEMAGWTYPAEVNAALEDQDD